MAMNTKRINPMPRVWARSGGVFCRCRLNWVETRIGTNNKYFLHLYVYNIILFSGLSSEPCQKQKDSPGCAFDAGRGRDPDIAAAVHCRVAANLDVVSSAAQLEKPAVSRRNIIVRSRGCSIAVGTQIACCRRPVSIARQISTRRNSANSASRHRIFDCVPVSPTADHIWKNA